jgi:hypothetical protein
VEWATRNHLDVEALASDETGGLVVSLVAGTRRARISLLNNGTESVTWAERGSVVADTHWTNGSMGTTLAWLQRR